MGNVGSQSAMEYLMTYGWAILIVAVILGALYSLGIFNSSNFMPKAPPGGCNTFRPKGPGSSFNVQLVGSCNNALPQYVAQFGGAKSSVVARNPASMSDMLNITVVAWVMPLGDPNAATFVSTIGQTGYGGSDAFTLGTDCGWDDCGPPNDVETFYIENQSNGELDMGNFPNALKSGTWYMVAATTRGTPDFAGSYALYLNGVAVQSGGGAGIYSIKMPIDIGSMVGWSGTGGFTGDIADVQIYNISLPSNSIQYLYREGIGGDPISLYGLVGWWPLNGDTLDYSGNGNNGVPANIIFNGTWTSGYAIT